MIELDEFVIGLSGTLEVNKTADNIIKIGLPGVAQKLNALGNDKNPLRITAVLNETDTTRNIQETLNRIGERLTLNISDGQLANITRALEQIGRALEQPLNNNSFIQQIRGRIDALEAFENEANNVLRLTQRINNAGQTTSQTAVSRNGFETSSLTERYNYDNEGRVTSTTTTQTVVQDFEAQQKAIANAELTADKYRQTLQALSEGVVRSTSKDFLSTQEFQTRVLSDIQRAQYEIDRLAQTTDKNAFDRQKLAIDGTITSIKTYISEMQKVEVQTKNAESAAKKYSEQLERAQQKAIGESANKRITDPQQVAELQTQYNEVLRTIEEVRNSTADNFRSAQIDAQTALQTYNDMVDRFKRLNTLATQFREYSVPVIREKNLADIDALLNRLTRLGLAGETSLEGISTQFQTVGEGIATLRENLSNIGDTDRQGMVRWLDDFSIFKSQISEITEGQRLQEFAASSRYEFVLLGQEISKTSQTISNSGFANSPELEQFRTQIQQLMQDYANAVERINTVTNNGQDNTAMLNMAREIQETTDTIRQRLSLTENAFKRFQATAKSALNVQNLDADKQTLSNNIQIWLNNNTKASERMQKAMRDLRSQIQSADRETLKNLKKQFTELKKEAEATGDVGKSFFDTLKSNIAKFTGWYGIGNAISSIRREIVGAVSDLREMDTLLTEISKTSDRTEMELQQLGQSAYSAASGYGRTVQDYLSGVLEMSRAGYANSEAMAELSLKAQSAGDMTAELANQYLIATDAAYHLRGSEEQLSNILDGQNKINIIVPLYGNISRCSLLLSGKP